MNRLVKIHDITNKINDILNQDINSNNRESIISEVTKLIDQRGEFMAALEPPYNEVETEMGKSLIPINLEIERLMNKIFDDLKFEMKQVQKQKNTTSKYKNPYKAVETADGMFMDSKN